MKSTLISLCALTLLEATPAAFAKLPEPTPAERAKVADAAARATWSASVDAYQLCKAQDSVAARYRSKVEAAGKPAPVETPTPACTDPGPYVAAGSATKDKPLEASGAHSPAATAISPPSSSQPAAEANPTSPK